MPLRSSIGLGMLVAALLLGLSCSGPAPSTSKKEETSRPYHVQLDRIEDKDTANRILGEALTWWKANASAVEPRPMTGSTGSPVTVVWRAPLYRIRIGPFASRAEADSVLRLAQPSFPDAFVHPARRSPPSK